MDVETLLRWLRNGLKFKPIAETMSPEINLFSGRLKLRHAALFSSQIKPSQGREIARKF